MLRPPAEIEITLQAMKKVELHVHIEGGIAPEILFELARKNNISLPANSIAELRDWFAFTGFPHFGEKMCIRDSVGEAQLLQLGDPSDHLPQIGQRLSG